MNDSSLLPPSADVPIDRLAAIFGNTTNSYKFYWLLSILECVKDNQLTVIPIDHLIARMIANVWYPVHYFKLSFGKQDQISSIVLSIRSEILLSADASKSEIVAAVTQYMKNGSALAKAISALKTYVPYRFLRPFFDSQLRGVVDWKVNRLIWEMAGQAFNDPAAPCLYRYVQTAENGESIEIHQRWLAYLQVNLPIVMGYCLWNLVGYLQRNNPNVPNISGKIFAPERRDLKESRRFWRLALNALNGVHCIYSGEILRAGYFSLDHFIPWSFVAHDLMWNIIPTNVAINSAKSAQVPSLQAYLNPFVQLQYNAVQAVAAVGRENLLEDYILLYKKQSIAELQSMPVDEFKQVLYDTIAPQVQIAKNMGFTVNWSYSA